MIHFRENKYKSKHSGRKNRVDINDDNKNIKMLKDKLWIIYYQKKSKKTTQENKKSRRNYKKRIVKHRKIIEQCIQREKSIF